jgi:circadian clock protein KaiC
MSNNALVSTNVEGLDDVLRGGLPRGGFHLVQGDPGSGKTTLALQFVQGRIAAHERCLYVSLTESRRDLEITCRAHGWTLEGVDLLDLTRPAALGAAQGSIFHPADTELSELTDRVLAEVVRLDPRNVVFDGLSELRLLSGDPLRYRRQLLSMKEFFAERDVTVLLLDDRTSQFGELQPESMVGGSIVLDKFMPEYGRARRRLHVSKIRGAHFREGYHDYEIETGGVRVHPRLVASDHHGEVDAAPWPSGIANLDRMLSGGLTGGSTTLFLGPAGAGKSTIALQYVVSALQSGKKAAVYASTR